MDSPSSAFMFPGVLHNAYRILGLPANAPMEAVYAANSALPRKLRVGLDQTTPWDLPWLGPLNRTESTVHEAFARLRDPVSRIRERLFWFAEGDEVLATLTPGTALRAAVGWEAADRPLASHHGALLRLISASLTDANFQQCSLWEGTLVAWRRVREDEGFWLDLYDAEATWEPRATLDNIEELQQQVLELVTSPIAASARRALHESRHALPGRVLAILQTAKLPSALLDSLTTDVLAPLEDQVEASCSEIVDSLHQHVQKVAGYENENRRFAILALERFAMNVEPGLRLIQQGVVRDHELSRRIRLAAASCLRLIAIDFTWSDEFIQAEQLLLRACEIAHDTSLGPRLLEDTNQVHAGAELQRQQQRQKEAEERAAREAEQRRQSTVYWSDGTRTATTHTTRQEPPRRSPSPGPIPEHPRPDQAFDVIVPVDRSLRIPNVCTCCLGPADTEEPVSASITFGNTRRTVSLRFPVCRECQTHRSQFFWHRTVGALGGTGLSLLAAYILGQITGTSWNLLAAIFVSALLCPAFAILQSMVLPLKVLAPAHASRSGTVALSLKGSSSVRIRFWNGDYAYEFSKANGLKFEATNVRNHSRAPSIMQGKSAFQVSVVAIVLSVLAIVTINPGVADSAPTATNRQPNVTTAPARAPAPATNPSSTSKSALKARIDSLKTQIDALESQIRQKDDDLDSMQSRLDTLKGTADAFEPQAKKGAAAALTIYNQSIHDYNALVPQYNALLAERKRLYSQYSDLLTQHNQLVDQYNAQ